MRAPSLYPLGLLDALERNIGAVVRVTLRGVLPAEPTRKRTGQLHRGQMRGSFYLDEMPITRVSSVTRIERRWPKLHGGADYTEDWAA